MWLSSCSLSMITALWLSSGSWVTLLRTRGGSVDTWDGWGFLPSFDWLEILLMKPVPERLHWSGYRRLCCLPGGDSRFCPTAVLPGAGIPLWGFYAPVLPGRLPIFRLPAVPKSAVPGYCRTGAEIPRRRIPHSRCLG